MQVVRQVGDIGRLRLIINRDRLRKVETLSRAEAHVTLDGVDEPVTLGRTAAQRLREALER